MMQFLKMRWLFNRQVGISLLSMAALFLVAFAVNVLGIRLAGDVQNWSAWLKTHASVFLIWRISLYMAAGAGWWWMRQRVIQRETETTDHLIAKNRFIRIEISVIATLLALEISQWFF